MSTLLPRLDTASWSPAHTAITAALGAEGRGMRLEALVPSYEKR
jgi:hypothetical protein